MLSPQQLGYALDRYASGNSVGIGAMLVIYNLMIVGRMVDEGQEFLNLVFGIWLMLSPSALGFAGLRDAALNSMACGFATMLLAAWSIYRALARRK